MVEPRYRLVWPKELFIWEAKRVRLLPEDILFHASTRLLSEAFDDPAVVSAFSAEFGTRNVFESGVYTVSMRGWLLDLTKDDSRLMPYVAPRYYAERGGHTSAPDNPYDALGVQYAALLLELQDRGYFPIALPRWCSDAPVNFDEVSERVRRAIHMPFGWDGTQTMGGDWDEPVLYSIIEYFHDQAQRPRTILYHHEYGDCGPHYDAHSAESGGAVYRWRVNELLRRHRVELVVGRSGEERGRLIHRFGSPIDDSADARAAEGEGNPEDEVAHAIRDFRERGASSTQKRQALALLAGALESRRGKAKVLLGKDEDDLFNIANNFGIRHRNDRQRTAYGDEFLDYMFGTFLSSVTLLEALERRDAGQPETGAPVSP